MTDKDIDILKEARSFLSKLGLIKERTAIENVLSELETKRFQLYLQNEELENALKKIETYKKIAEKLAEKVEEIAYEMHLDEIYAELHNCEGVERNWNRGKEAEIKDIIDWARKEVENNGMSKL